MNEESAVLRCTNLDKVYSQGPQQVNVLQGLNLTVAAAEQIAVVGASGSGKTTLLNMLGGLDLPTGGKVYVASRELSSLNETERGALRNRYLGFVYQFHHLLGEFTALENVCMPLLIGGTALSEADERGSAMLEKVGLKARLAHKPAELSGGERQRVAIARALVTRPRCVLLDEPTGNLDRETALDVQQLMLHLNRELATSFIVVTHDEHLAQSMHRRLILRDGQLHEN
ncbi:MAG: lipoprotein-releasing ABC transporter ATP-binding protein LolD [Pseudohongiellaceae bacterium]